MAISAIVRDKILQITGAERLAEVTPIQSLWGGLGELFRVSLVHVDSMSDNTNIPQFSSVVVKHILFRAPVDHPRGWNSDLSFQRKMRSYDVEQHWYQTYADSCLPACRVPRCLFVERRADEMLLVLEDLAIDFPELVEAPNVLQIEACIYWLANFHARFLDQAADGLWPVGGYWHLDTRPDELAAMTDLRLQQAAPALDRAIKQCRYQTLIHGDAKLANFCFSADGKRAAAVDFQYVGQGPGIKDLMLFISSAVPPALCEEWQEPLLDTYFRFLFEALQRQGKTAVVDWPALEQEWRFMFAITWADFQRFVQGWCPDHWKINDYSRSITEQALLALDQVAAEPTGVNPIVASDNKVDHD
ncbi:DUF1679 domain-containing protein [Corallincola luteus]|uniref:DUF1679 domain-containing protein n=1 Tax=Corallincola luteus TaxID=1775177 RepID=A0ABY2AK41_9GAMM|nr:phosphotransferase [Corallincola luteus]TCI01710.1 DUF1679 domain-containing protein [Corallincola luteus]